MGKKSGKILRGIAGISALFLTVLLVATPVANEYEGVINKALNIQTSKIVDDGTDSDVDSAYYKSNYYEKYGDDLTSKSAALKVEKDAAAECVNQVEEGAVLLKNDNDALPLAEGSGITIFGNGAVNSAYNKSKESSTISELPLVTFSDAMSEVYNVNTSVIDQYKTMSSLQRSNGTRVYEADISTVTSKSSTWASGYNDAAVVVFTRWGTEDIDINMYDTNTSDNRSILALHDNEIALLEYLQRNKGTGSGQFDKIIVVLNSDHPMELGDLDSYGVDACLWAGVPGTQGFTGIANVMTGEVNPSGRLVDTYAKNSRSAPACAYSLENTQVWSNASEVNSYCTDGADNTNYYTIYAEGIYVGYKYYETRYADYVTNSGGARSSAGSSTGSGWNYADEMCYTFGYGLSYTTFTQTLKSVTFDSSEDTYTVTVEVKNTGKVAGKSVVEVYAQTPYGDYEKEHGIEKSAIQMAGFEKTDLLESGDSQTVEVVIDRYLLASYDSDGAKGYILSSGDYYFSVGDNAHDALNNILALQGYTAEDGLIAMDGGTATPNTDNVYKFTQNNIDGTTYKYSDSTGNEVTNLFDDADINYYDGQDFTYLTRSDWEGTFPKNYSGASTNTSDWALSISATKDMMDDINVPDYEMPEDAEKASETNQATTQLDYSGMIKFILLKDVDYASDFWETYLDQFTVEQLGDFMLDSSGGTSAMECIDMPSVIRADDGVCIQQATLIATGETCMAWPSEVMTSSTWNKECFTARGEMLAQEAFYCGANEVWYGGGNLHRTPFSGRNMQYYSEDGNMGYYVGAYEAAAMQKYGITYGIKHFALNDQECYRQGLNTFANEQTMREQYLRAFEGAICEGGALGIMLGFNRVGCTPTMTDKALVTDLLRDEWGYQGHVTTDAYTSSAYKSHYLEEVAAGVDYYCWDGANVSAAAVAQVNTYDDGYMLSLMRNAAKHTLYVNSRSITVNGLTTTSRVVSITPWWQTALFGATIGFGVLTGAAFVASVLLKYIPLKRKGKEEPDETTTEIL